MWNWLASIANQVKPSTYLKYESMIRNHLIAGIGQMPAQLITGSRIDQLADEKNTDEAWTEKVALFEAMEKLGEREKRILFLRYFEGKTQTEISAEVGISQAQVSRLEKNAIENIRLNIS